MTRKADEILDKFYDDVRNTFEEGYNIGKRKAKKALYKDLLVIVGKDLPVPEQNNLVRHNAKLVNNHRADLRKELREYFGQEEA